MRLLLDTHAWVCWNTGSSRLPQAAADLIRDRRNEVHVSAASVWEVVTKHRLAPDADPFVHSIEPVIDADGFLRLPVTTVHAYRAARLDHPHKDPFDRLLVAQALSERLTLVSNETPFDFFGADRTWS